MASQVFTGWRSLIPGKCLECGSAEDWSCDGRGNVLCDCQACPDCGILDAYGFHNPGCPVLAHEEQYAAYEDADTDDDF